jgi:C4-dicarboxylate transporter DctQ subunit
VKMEKIINSGVQFFCGAMLVAMVGLTFLQIILRQFFNFTFNWSDEVSQFCMTWLALFGSIWCTQNSKHLNTGIKLHGKLNERLVHLIDGILALYIVGISAIATYYSATFAFSVMGLESMSLGWLKMGYIFSALPIAMLFLSYYYLKSFCKNIRLIFKKE